MVNEIPINAVKQIPKNKVVEGVIVDLELKTWKELIPADKINKFKDPNEKQIIVKYDVEGLIITEKLKYEETPFSTTRLGKFINRYGALKVGTKIQVNFDHESKATILI